ncbi:hypothetical protein CXG81DRAFT_3293, partial [Caulochytrium protostelioides]
KKSATGKAAKAPTPYNLFMKSELPKVKSTNPNLSHREAFTAAAKNWATSPQNPKNK